MTEHCYPAVDQWVSDDVSEQASSRRVQRLDTGQFPTADLPAAPRVRQAIAPRKRVGRIGHVPVGAGDPGASGSLRDDGLFRADGCKISDASGVRFNGES